MLSCFECSRIETLYEEEVDRQKSRVVDPVGVDLEPDPTLEKNRIRMRSYFDMIFFSSLDIKVNIVEIL